MNIGVLDEESVLVSGYLDVSERPDESLFDAVVASGLGRPYSGRAHHWTLGNLPACDFTDPASVRVRPLNRSLTRSAEDFTLGVLVEGEGQLRTGTHRHALHPGTMVIYPQADFDLELDGPYHYVVASIPGSRLQTFRRVELGSRLPALTTTSPAIMLSTLLSALPATVDTLAPGVRTQLSEVVTSLLLAAITESSTARRIPPPLYAQILDWIDAHLGDTDLSPARVAAVHHISPSYLFKLFREQRTTLGDHIAERRLEHIRGELADPVLRAVSIQSIGARWGYPDASHLSRVFRARFGVAPRTFRADVT